jgi:hypothetical protein
MEAESFLNMSLRIAHRVHDEQTALFLDHSVTRCVGTTTHHCKVGGSAEHHVCIPPLQDHSFHRRIARKHRLRLPGATS